MPEAPSARGAILSLQSGVLAGSVGHGAFVPACALLGHAVFAVPTVLLSGHAASLGVARVSLSAEQVGSLARAVLDGPLGDQIGLIHTGYLADGDIALAVAEIVGAAKARGARYLCDPVLGDDGRAYLPQGVADVIRERLIPMADRVVPNLFELSLLTGRPVDDIGQVEAAARALGPETVMVSSVPLEGGLGMLTVRGDNVWHAAGPALDWRVNGAGDFVSALAAHAMLAQHPLERMARACVDAFAAVAPRAMRQGRDDLPVVEHAGDWLAAFRRAVR